MNVMEMIRRKFYDLVISDFAGEYGEALSIKLENHKFQQPIDEPFLALYMINTASARASIGTVAKFQRHCGFLCIECQVPAETGTGAMWLMAEAVTRVLEEKQTSLDDGSYFTTGTAKKYGNTSQDANYFVTVMVPFDADECKP